MGPPVIRSESLKAMKKSVSLKSGTANGPEIRLARIFLISIFGAGMVSCFLGFSPENLALIPCPFHSVTGIQCPGCGMTRACIALANGDLGDALRYNPLSLGLVFLAAGFAMAPYGIRRNWLRFPPGIRTMTKWSMLSLVFGFWVYRILP